MPLKFHRVDHVHLEMKFLSHFFQVSDGALASPAKRVIVTHHDLLHADFADQNIFGKFPRLLVGKTLIEIRADDLVDAALLNQFHFLAEARQQRRRFFRRDDFQRMRFKCEYDTRSLILTGDLRHPAEDDLVPQMHAVEIADRHHRVRAGIGDMFGAANDLHK